MGSGREREDELVDFSLRIGDWKREIQWEKARRIMPADEDGGAAPVNWRNGGPMARQNAERVQGDGSLNLPSLPHLGVRLGEGFSHAGEVSVLRV